VVTASVELCLVRHCATEWGEAGRIQGRTDVPLSDAGRAQARTLAGTLSAADFSGVWSSDLQRARETARLAVGAAQPDPRLRELDFGELEGRTWDETPPAVQRSMMEFDGFTAPGGESVREMRTRVLDFVASLPPGSHLVFTHGGVIRLLRQHATGESAGGIRVAPGEIVRLRVTAKTD
jgi:probable phosphoglycerate mutase